ncbi:AEC family transporter [Cellulomonas sp. ACRRI]|uniref:AEC family transporter n=1 Tax=Cellulomonas sp. ACRRI TaxID=2918188 RepID=UPI001EF21919|nr:AEC family transporter [Cellulomonas sp. ACRRI]MCG7286733.1 AEC family transporter [Cellulomonas sp. ACRRI]
MLAVLTALGTIAVVVAAGWFVGRTGVLGDNAQRVLAATAFTVATPALLIETIGRADLGLLLSRSALVTFATTTVVALVAAAVLGLIRRRSAGDVVVGVLASSYVNAGNIGIPLTAYLLGSVVSVVPPTLYQQLVLGPIAMVVLDARRRARDGVVAGTAPAGALGTLRSVLRRTLRNPVIIGTLTGIALAALPFSLPAAVFQPLELLGAAAPPLALLTFGMSLAVPRVGDEQAPRGDVALVAVLRAVVHPALAIGLGTLLGLRGDALLAVAVVSALPTAQNVLVYAIQYRQGTALARDAGLVTTILAVPSLLVIAAVLG